MRRAATLGLVLLTGCGGCALLGTSSERDAASRAREADACTPGALSTRPSLVGADTALREAVEAGAKQHIVVVKYGGDSCDARLEILADCHAPGRYAYQPEPKQTKGVVKSEAMSRELPFASPTDAEAVRFDARRVAILHAPEATRIDRAGLVGECEGATHVAMQIDIGGFGVAKGTVAALEQGGVVFSPDIADGRVGDPNDCSVAERRKRRTGGCDRAIALDLVPVTNETIELGPVDIAAGTYRLGKSKVELAAYAIDRREVTAAQYQACVDAGACKEAAKFDRCTAGVPEKSRHPANCVTAEQAESYCAWKKQRLPTEAEWERAARGADDASYTWGSAWPPPEGAANLADSTAKTRAPHWEAIEGYVDGFPETAPVGALVQYPSASGITGAGGNVMEWTADWADRRKTARVVKGSSFGHADKTQARVTSSNAYDANRASAHIGFRCARDAAAAAAAE